ncbi:uncharacterized protein [Elaeis guineensis]|uniref:Uncharacterized protein LOC105052486 isoform X2 n=1 Tax=Elaeis guineensis var. tenera TaxID=51953 RepID=A0A8N4F3I0_ELAGV|nr:uncharacterized protein LOC105052486 isoform X2 [Elaeis guineensis]
MGQALRRATGRVRPSRSDHPARPPIKNPERPPPSPTAAAQAKPPDAPTVGQDRLGISDAEVTARDKDYNGALEERDPKYDEMLKQMVGRITSRPGGKLEMGDLLVAKASIRNARILKMTMGFHSRKIQQTNAKTSEFKRRSCAKTTASRNSNH